MYITVTNVNVPLFVIQNHLRGEGIAPPIHKLDIALNVGGQNAPTALLPSSRTVQYKRNRTPGGPGAVLDVLSKIKCCQMLELKLQTVKPPAQSYTIYIMRVPFTID